MLYVDPLYMKSGQSNTSISAIASSRPMSLNTRDESVRMLFDSEEPMGLRPSAMHAPFASAVRIFAYSLVSYEEIDEDFGWIHISDFE